VTVVTRRGEMRLSTLTNKRRGVTSGKEDDVGSKI
jgi:hypothetical protein